MTRTDAERERERERERGPKVTNEDFSNRLDSESVKIIFEHFGSETSI